MLKKIKFFLFLILFLSLFKESFSYAQKENIYIYCTTKNKKWEWLKDKLGNYVQVKGVWKEAESIIYAGQGGIEKLGINYFQIKEKDAAHKIKRFQSQCIDLYGADYQFAQPAYSRFTNWRLFASDDYHNNLSKGLYQAYLINTRFQINTFYLEGINEYEYVEVNQFLKSIPNTSYSL